MHCLMTHKGYLLSLDDSFETLMEFNVLFFGEEHRRGNDDATDRAPTFPVIKDGSHDGGSTAGCRGLLLRPLDQRVRSYEQGDAARHAGNGAPAGRQVAPE